MANHRLLFILSPSVSLFFFFFFVSFHGVHSNFSAICDPDSPSSVCGNVKIRYPFWNISRAAVHCGYQGFRLNCQYSSVNPTLSLWDDTYFVTNINYDGKNLTLVDDGVTDQQCPRARYNLTLDSLPLYYNSGNVNLTFFFNCTAALTASIAADAVAIDCLESGDNRSFVFVSKTWEEVAGFGKELDCEDAVAVPVKRTNVTAGNVAEEFARAMSEGFVLDWGTAKECGECEHSGGRCAVSETEHLQCFCDDETILTGGSVCKGKERGLRPFYLGKWFLRHFSDACAWIPA